MLLETSDILVLVGIAIVFGLLYPYTSTYLVYNRRAKQVGCGIPPTDFAFPLGMGRLYLMLKEWKNCSLLDYFNRVFKSFNTRTGRVFVSGQWWIGTQEPENIKAILATSFKDFSLGYRYDAAYGLLGNGIFTLSGEGWKHSRAMLRPQFTREQVSHLDTMHEHINMMIDKHFKGGEVVDAQALYHMLTIDTASEFLFGESTNTLVPSLANQKFPGPNGDVTGAQFAQSFTYALEILSLRIMAGPIWFLVWTPKFKKACSVCHNFIDYFVSKALADPLEKEQQSDDDRYVFIRELTRETRDPKAIRDQALNILLAGRDTTAALLSYTTFYLSANPKIYDELREEVLSEFGSEDRTVTFEQLKHCKLLQNVLREVLRLHPVVPLNFRASIRDTKLPVGGGPNKDEPIFVPKGTNVFYSTYAMQRDETIWGPRATEFDPHRWEEPRNAFSNGWDYIPFNGGPRICLGQQFALTEASFTLLRICQEFSRIEVLHPDINADQKHMKQVIRLTSSVDGGVLTRFHK